MSWTISGTSRAGVLGVFLSVLNFLLPTQATRVGNSGLPVASM